MSGKSEKETHISVGKVLTSFVFALPVKSGVLVPQSCPFGCLRNYCIGVIIKHGTPEIRTYLCMWS